MAPRAAIAVLAGIVALALAVRVALAFAAPFPVIAGDPAVYDEIAVALASGEGFSRLPRRPGGAARPTALHPPAWPALLGATYAVAGHDSATARWRAGRVVQAALGAAAVGLLGVVAWQLWGAALGVLAAALGALYPPLTVLGLALLSEPLFVVLELGAVAAALRFRAVGGLRWALLAGVLAGLATLTRNNGIALVLPLLLAVWPGRRSLAAPAAMAAGVLVVVVPWTVRNAVVFGAFVPVATNLGQTLAGTYNAESARHFYRWRSPRLLPPARRAELRAMSETERSASLARDGLRYIREHPAAPLVVSAENTGRLGELDPEARAVLRVVVGSQALAKLSIAGFAVFALLAAAGALTARARATPRFVWLAPVLLWLSVIPFAVNFSRFRAPLDPWLILLAALAVAALLRSRIHGAPRRA